MTHTWRVFTEWEAPAPPGMYPEPPPMISHASIEGGFLSRFEAEAFLRAALQENPDAHGHVEYWWSGADRGNRSEPTPAELAREGRR